MKQFLDRLLRLFGANWAASGTAKFQSAVVSSTQPQAAFDAPPTKPASTGASAVAALFDIGARRPLIAADGAIVGFEFRIDRALQMRLQRRPDHRGQSAYVAALFTSARLMVQTGRIGVARVPRDWLLLAGDLVASDGVWVAIGPAFDEANQAASETLIAPRVAQLRASGARVGWDVSDAFGSAPDFLVLCQGSATMEAQLVGMQSWPSSVRNLPTLMTDIANPEDLEQALYGGVTYACGALNTVAQGAVQPTATQSVPPEVARVAYLLNELTKGAETPAIVQDLKADVGLSYRLLRRMKSASFAHLSSGASIDQAVMLLGRNELYRWLSMLLLEFSGRRKISSALQEVALWRSRLLELLAIESGHAEPGQLFTLGLASMLAPLLKISMADVVATLHLPEPARQALLEQTGPWFPYLALALEVEQHSLAGDDPLAAPFGGAERVVVLAGEAWDWAWAAEHRANDSGLK